MTRGHRGWLALRCLALSSIALCRFIPAHQFHHVDPHALGGEASVDKIELRCLRHNDYEGRLYFGKRRRDETGAAREVATSHPPQPFETTNLFQNKLAGGASPSTRSAGVEPQR